MKHFFNVLPKLTALAAIVLSVSSCNRAEYASLPKTTPYHATYGTIKSVPAPAAAVSEEVVVTETPVAPIEEKNSAVVPAVAAPSIAAVKTAARAHTATAVVAPAAAPKPNLAQRLALNKVSKQLNKLTSKTQIKQHSETAEANAISGNLRTGIILLLVGLLVSLLSGVSSIFGLIGGIIAIIGVIFIVLWLLDAL